MKPNIGIVLAGGSGTRYGADCPKQFLDLCGRMIIEYTVDAFEKNAFISEIAIVVHLEWVDVIRRLIDKNGWRKVKRILIGGKERYDSSLAAIRAYSGQDVNLIFHDAVRPFISQRILDDVANALVTHEAIDVTVPCTDTIVAIDDGYLASIPDRTKLNRGQTPQAFRIGVIQDAYAKGLNDPGFKTSDDCGVVCKYRPDVPVFIVRGEEKNMKLTYPEDLCLMELIYHRNEEL